MREMRRDHPRDNPAAAPQRCRLHRPDVCIQQDLERRMAGEHIALSDIFDQNALRGLQGFATGGGFAFLDGRKESLANPRWATIRNVSEAGSRS